MSKDIPERIFLSRPHMGGDEMALVKDAFESNWIAPLGPHVDGFEQEFAARIGVSHAAALSSGTAAIHLALILLGIGRGDRVYCPSLTFCASANPILYVGATAVFIDVEPATWNLCPDRLLERLEDDAKNGTLPKALIAVDLYGQTPRFDAIIAACERFEIPIIEDAAEALGATYRGASAGTFGRIGVFSFNGNKLITTSGGGMLVSDNEHVVTKARFLATQARDSAPHYQHSELGFNYRLSNILAAIGRGQLRVVDERVRQRRAVFERYREALGNLPGLTFMPETPMGSSSRWLTTVTIEPTVAGVDREDIRVALEAENIEARPVWKPLHLQPLFKGFPHGECPVSESLFEKGLCLPSGSDLSIADQERVAAAICHCFRSK